MTSLEALSASPREALEFEALDELDELEELEGRLLGASSSSSAGAAWDEEELLPAPAGRLELPEALLEELSAELEDELPDEADPELTPPSNETVRVLLVTWLSL